MWSKDIVGPNIQNQPEISSSAVVLPCTVVVSTGVSV